jgi:hypothetical protein
MSHWAELDENNKVIRVTVGDNNDPNGDEGYQWLVDNLGGSWVQTSYNGNFRARFAGIGYTYDQNLDAFITPQPFPSWLLDQNHEWQAPVPYPDSEFTHYWDENAQEWVLTNFAQLGE